MANLFGLLGGALGGFGSQQEANWQQMQGQLAAVTTNGTAATNTSGHTIGVAFMTEEYAKPHKETALEWLDRRVNEVRFSLAP